MKILFLSFTCEDIGVAMVTNMIGQLEESFPLQARGQFFLNFIQKMASRCEDGTVTVITPLQVHPSFITFLWQAFCDRWPVTSERYFQHSKIKFVSPRGHVISSMYAYNQRSLPEILRLIKFGFKNCKIP